MVNVLLKGGEKEMSDQQAEKRQSKNIELSPASIRILNRLSEKDMLEKGLPARDCKNGRYVDEALLLLATKEGIIVDQF
jgi:hypothetical protein